MKLNIKTTNPILLTVIAAIERTNFNLIALLVVIIAAGSYLAFLLLELRNDVSVYTGNFIYSSALVLYFTGLFALAEIVLMKAIKPDEIDAQFYRRTFVIAFVLGIIALFYFTNINI